MRDRGFGVFCAGVLGSLMPVAAASAADAGNWPCWRGPEMNGIAADAAPPLAWSEQKNIRWKRELPGQGLSTPIVWGDRVYVQLAERADGKEEAKGDSNEGRGRGRGRGRGPAKPTEMYKFVVLALDRATGETVWEKVVRTMVPHEGSHNDGSLAPASPVTDGEHLYAQFGSRGLYCMAMDGTMIWAKDLGQMQTRNGFGEGSSPALHGDTLIVNWDHEGDSFIVAFDKKTGEERWRKPRDEQTSWVTPFIIEDGGKTQVVVTGTNKIRSYDLKTGDVVWECGGLGSNCVPTPVERDGVIYTMTGHREPALLAIRYRGASGDITGSERVLWTLNGGTPYVPSPLLYGDALYFTQKNSGILSCYDAAKGKPFYDQQRLEDISGIYSSLIGAKDRVYVVGRNGATVVLQRGPAFEILAVNKLDDSFTASPAIAGNEMFLRGLKNLYCIGEK